MAMVLLGVPRGQNFVAEAADEATKSVALLTLTATGDENEPVKADMTWKRFVPGTTGTIDVAFRFSDGSLAGTLDAASYSGGSSVPAPDWVSAWLVASGTSSVSLHSCFSVGTGVRLLSLSSEFVSFGSIGLSVSQRGWFPPVWLACDPGPSFYVPGLWRSNVDGLLKLSSDDLPAGNGFTITSDNPAVVTVLASGDLRAVSAGSATVTWTDDLGDCQLLCAVADSWVPPHEVPAGLTAVAGTRLGDVALPAPTADGAWAWVHPDDLLTTPGTTTHKALYTPTDIENYGSVVVDVPVEVYLDVLLDGHLETTVTVNGQTQRIILIAPAGVLPRDTVFSAEYVDATHGDYNFFIQHLDPTTDVELQHFYNLTLTSGGRRLTQLDAPVELLFEAIPGIDAEDSFISRVAEGEDVKLEARWWCDLDGVSWILVSTDHFSPYALTDLLSEEEKATLVQEDSGPKYNVTTGDLTTQITVAGLGMTLVLAMGIMLRLITSKNQFDE